MGKKVRLSLIVVGEEKLNAVGIMNDSDRIKKGIKTEICNIDDTSKNVTWESIKSNLPFPDFRLPKEEVKTRISSFYRNLLQISSVYFDKGNYEIITKVEVQED